MVLGSHEAAMGWVNSQRRTAYVHGVRPETAAAARPSRSTVVRDRVLMTPQSHTYASKRASGPQAMRGLRRRGLVAWGAQYLCLAVDLGPFIRNPSTYHTCGSARWA
jgi:hypothetical protein